jgi:hypothetical protein
MIISYGWCPAAPAAATAIAYVVTPETKTLFSIDFVEFMESRPFREVLR